MALKDEDSHHTVFSSAILTQDYSEISKGSSCNVVDTTMSATSLPHTSDYTMSNLLVYPEDSSADMDVGRRSGFTTYELHRL